MSVHASCANIEESIKDLNMVWQQTKAVWKDAKARQFEKEFMTQLSFEIKKTQTALNQIGVIHNHIRSELRD